MGTTLSLLVTLGVAGSLTPPGQTGLPVDLLSSGHSQVSNASGTGPRWQQVMPAAHFTTPHNLSSVTAVPAPAGSNRHPPGESDTHDARAVDNNENPDDEDDEDEEEEGDPGEVLDDIRHGVEASVDATARWFDSFFGDSRAFDYDYRSRGRVSLAPEYSQYSQWRVRASLRAQVNLPVAEDRLSAFVGRADFDDFATGDDTDYRSSVIPEGMGDREWIVGLGFDPHQGETSRFSISAGVRGGISLDPYVAGRYLWQYRLTDSTQLRTRSSVFWRDSDGFGTNQRLDYEVSLRERWLGRFSVDATLAERTEGVRWRTTSSLYHLYHRRRAVAAEVWYRGEHHAEVPLEDYGVRFIHRREVSRAWFFVESWVGLHRPRTELIETRSNNWLVGLQAEMWFGPL